MPSIRRASAGVTLASLTCLLPLLSGTAHAGLPAPVTAGDLAYITAGGELDLVTVTSDGTTTTPQRLGPVTTAAAPHTVAATDLVASSDGAWLAWSEIISEPSTMYGSIETGSRIAVRNMGSGKTITLRGNEEPLGFAGHTLVVVGAHTKRLVMTPTPHLVTVHEGNAYPVATYAKGVVDVSSGGPSTKKILDHEQLRLTTFAGHHTDLHDYAVPTSTYRSVSADLDAVSPDGKKLLVERGNHQDFDGLGPSSLFDDFSMTGVHARKQLGHYGTDKAVWRLASATFVGPDDTPWLALHSTYVKTSSGYAVRGVVVSYSGGAWRLQAAGAIAVAGNAAGYVVVQPGSWVAAKNSPDGEYDPTPAGQISLEGPGGTHPLPVAIEGSQLLWV